MNRHSRRAAGTGQVFKDGSGWRAVFVVGYQDSGKAQEKKARFSRYGDAEAWLIKLRSDYATGKAVPIGKVTLAQWLDEWLVSIAGRVAPKTHTYYTYLCAKHLKPALGGIELRQVSPGSVQTLINNKVASGLSASTVNGMRATLRRALNVAKRRGMVTENSAALADGPKAVRGDPVFLSPEECKVFVGKLGDSPEANLFRVLLATGMRIGEAAGLRKRDIDWQRATISVSVQLQRVEGKLQHLPLKSTSSRRMLPLIDLARRALMDEQARHEIDGCENPMGLALLNEFGRPWDQKTANDQLKSALKYAGLRELSAHKLRHTAATLWLTSGVDPGTVRDLLGHSTIKLLDVYGHSLPASFAAAGKKLERAIKTGRVGSSRANKPNAQRP